jgi:methionine aminopeptidase
MNLCMKRPNRSPPRSRDILIVSGPKSARTVTRDRSLSAQFEHSVGVTDTGVEIFTLSQRHGEKPPVV